MLVAQCPPAHSVMIVFSLLRLCLYYSGYASGAVSSSTLSDDSLSVRSSGGLDDTPDRDYTADTLAACAVNTDGVSIYRLGYARFTLDILQKHSKPQ